MSKCYSHNLQVHDSALIENAMHSKFGEDQKALCGFDQQMHDEYKPCRNVACFLQALHQVCAAPLEHGIC